MNKDIKICFMGSPQFGKIVLERLIEEFTVVLVVTQKDSFTKGGRVRIVQPVKELALEHNIPVFESANIKEDYSMMKEYEYSFLVTAAYGQFIPLDVLHLPKIMTLNVHGSLLPKYRGGAPIQRAIMNGDEYLGVSIMRTILKMDAGVIFKQSKVKLEDEDDYYSMNIKLAKVGAEDLVEVIEKMYKAIDSVTKIHQNVDEVTFANIITKDEEIIDFNDDAYHIFNKIRAFNPSPIARFNHANEMYQVFKAKVVKDVSDNTPGTIIENNKELIIKCKNNAISILEIKPQGKNKMDIKSFLNGYKNRFAKNEII